MELDADNGKIVCSLSKVKLQNDEEIVDAQLNAAEPIGCSSKPLECHTNLQPNDSLMTEQATSTMVIVNPEPPNLTPRLQEAQPIQEPQQPEQPQQIQELQQSVTDSVINTTDNDIQQAVSGTSNGTTNFNTFRIHDREDIIEPLDIIIGGVCFGYLLFWIIYSVLSHNASIKY